jgi:predicted unusual protein kinase regulating ubiquinone biosynthesis (AarF/ABC1/UbiB family)
MVEGFFHADPHPGNMKWWNDKIYLLDLGMVGEVDPHVRQIVLLLMLAFAQQDGSFLSEVVLALAGGEQEGVEVDFAAFREAVQDLVERYRHLSLKEIQLGPLLQEVTQISVRHRVRVPAALALMGKAFAQMQLVAADLDPTLDPFSVAESFVLRNTLRQLSGNLDPKALFFQAEKIRMRLNRVVEGIEGALGARPGANLQIHFRGTDRLEATIDQASRRLSYALGMCGALTVAAMTANRPGVPRWVPALMGGIGTAFAARLLTNRAKRDE